ncbi:hypothetical protein ACQBAT_12895 [Ornithinimicrobium sp. Y1847]|uniref:hypothetical protein n=1 Tax=unclassified Ornithinimicrobium TaxID=2615080 RepID=UPI003B676536
MSIHPRPTTLRQLEELLRRVFRAPSGIDLGAVAVGTQEQVTQHRARRMARYAVTLAIALVAILLGWFLGSRG